MHIKVDLISNIILDTVTPNYETGFWNSAQCDTVFIFDSISTDSDSSDGNPFSCDQAEAEPFSLLVDYHKMSISAETTVRKCVSQMSFHISVRTLAHTIIDRFPCCVTQSCTVLFPAPALLLNMCTKTVERVNFFSQQVLHFFNQEPLRATL